jgi:hypothetical protein
MGIPQLRSIGRIIITVTVSPITTVMVTHSSEGELSHLGVDVKYFWGSERWKGQQIEPHPGY